MKEVVIDFFARSCPSRYYLSNLYPLFSKRILFLDISENIPVYYMKNNMVLGYKMSRLITSNRTT